jgi:hypothetical protein
MRSAGRLIWVSAKVKVLLVASAALEGAYVWPACRRVKISIRYTDIREQTAPFLTRSPSIALP